MARNGSGSYSNPYPNFVSGTVISSAQVDANNSDVATALTQSIAVDGQTTVTANLPMNAKKFTGLAVGSAATDSLNLGQAQAEAMHWCGTAGGSANAITLSPSPAITAYAAGQRFVWKASGSVNTGATTVAISGLGTIALQDSGAALVGGDHAAGKIYMGILDTTSTVQIINVQVSSINPLRVTSLVVSGTSLLTGVTTHGGNVVSDTDSTDDLGTTSVRWKDLFIDSITATDQVTATGFTGTLDGILGSGAAAAATVTTLNTSGAVTFNDAGADVDFRVEGDADTHLIFADASVDGVVLGGSLGTLFNAVGGAAKLTVIGSSASTNISGNTLAAMQIVNTDTTASNTAGLHFSRADTDDSPNYAGASIVAQFGETQATGQYPSASLNFATSSAQNAAPSLKMTIPAAGGIVLQDSGITGLTSINSGQIGGRNIVINGEMKVSQRIGTTATATGINTYLIDRYVSYASGGSAYTVQQVTDAPAGFKNAAKVTITTADSSIGSGDYAVMQYRAEGIDIAHFNCGTSDAETVTLSFWVKSSLTGNFGGAMRNGAVNRSYPYLYNIAQADTWEKKSVTLTLDTTGTWAVDTGQGLVFMWDFGSGTNFQGTADTWAGANYHTAGSQVKLIATNGATWLVTGVQLEIGSTATEFEHRTYGEELALCQRYYYQTVYGGSDTTIAHGTAASATVAAQCGSTHPVTMRAIPTLAEAGTLTAYDGSANGDIGISINSCSITNLSFNCTASSLTVGRAVQILANAAADYLTLTAEL